MATASATLSPVNFTAAVAPTRSTTTAAAATKVTYIKGLNSFGGLKAHTTVASLGSPVSTEQQFANFVCSLKKPSSSRGGAGGGGALTSTCNAAGEIFKIAAIMNGITLVGVAFGFILLRIEAIVEESE
ncbi:hypothetical protein SSX86_024064 [Deinandra increscens subsp. villosa]|uniref:PetM of cytochrome b6/f complex subunit 7 n=1 Tax=Deinandra increscens subsp. villosa TaxID=3103831 RepID=A0AAP0CM40_9ASTR